jgi:pentose-5-phosphate-3-epimerase
MASHTTEGANWIVAGSSVFKSENPASVIAGLKKSVEDNQPGKA